MTLDSGFKIKEALSMYSAEGSVSGTIYEKAIHAGYCKVPELEGRIRVSAWLFMPVIRFVKMIVD